MTKKKAGNAVEFCVHHFTDDDGVDIHTRGLVELGAAREVEMRGVPAGLLEPSFDAMEDVARGIFERAEEGDVAGTWDVFETVMSGPMLLGDAEECVCEGAVFPVWELVPSSALPIVSVPLSEEAGPSDEAAPSVSRK